MLLSRRGLILGGAAMMAGCSTAAAQQTPPLALVEAPVQDIPEIVVAPRTPEAITAELNTTRVLDPAGRVRPELLERAHAALDIHGGKIANRDRMYLVDFSQFSGDERFYEVDLHGGDIVLMRTTHGRGSDPGHTGFAHTFSNEPNSHMSSLGAYVTAGASSGPQQGPNVLLDGLEYSNDMARQRAIIVHGADYADPDFLAREGKLGRSYGCFSVAHGDLPRLRERMGEGRLLFAFN